MLTESHSTFPTSPRIPPTKNQTTALLEGHATYWRWGAMIGHCRGVVQRVTACRRHYWPIDVCGEEE